jgi:hypothetical protein
MLLSLVNHVYRWSCASEARAFSRGAPTWDQRQRQNLAGILAALKRPSQSYEEFAATHPLTKHADWAPSIQRQMNGEAGAISGPCARYQPTSGSGGERKWIPYSDKLLEEFDAASTPWVYDIMQAHPGVSRGSQYWSLSWLPDQDRRDMGLIDDSALFPAWKRWMVNQLFAVPKAVALARTSDESLFATAAFLAADKKLSLISVWSPSFLSALLDLIDADHVRLATVLESGTWPTEVQIPCPAPRSAAAARALRGLPLVGRITTWRALWPRLSLISCWTTALAAGPAARLAKEFPGVPIQGKGLWSTEAVLTIPLEGHYVLAYRSHFYEFLDTATGTVLPAWELRPGMRVSPVITTGSGLLRYQTEDLLEVEVPWRGHVPCLRFLGRQGHVDMVGEKLAQADVQQLLADFNAREPGLEALTLLALPAEAHTPASYVLLVTGPTDATPRTDFEQGLLNFFHYRLARDLHQLAPLRVQVLPFAPALYLRVREAGGMIRGNIKPEAITLVGAAAAQALAHNSSG